MHFVKHDGKQANRIDKFSVWLQFGSSINTLIYEHFVVERITQRIQFSFSPPLISYDR